LPDAQYKGQHQGNDPIHLLPFPILDNRQPTIILN
jgi:hypothetical protein